MVSTVRPGGDESSCADHAACRYTHTHTHAQQPVHERAAARRRRIDLTSARWHSFALRNVVRSGDGLRAAYVDGVAESGKWAGGGGRRGRNLARGLHSATVYKRNIMYRVCTNVGEETSVNS